MCIPKYWEAFCFSTKDKWKSKSTPYTSVIEVLGLIEHNFSVHVTPTESVASDPFGEAIYRKQSLKVNRDWLIIYLFLFF